MKNLSALGERFPARELEIHRLRAQDAEFRRVCEDYEVAMKALRHWEHVENNAVRAAEYRQIATEIAAEIAARLDTALPPLNALAAKDAE